VGGRGGEVRRVQDTEAIEKVKKEKEAEMRAFLERKDIAMNERKRIEEELRASEQRVPMINFIILLFYYFINKKSITYSF
jgi:hypothetical protein